MKINVWYGIIKRGDGMVAQVLIGINKLEKTFTYLVPDNLEKKCQVGYRVLVPFGKQILEGFIVAISDHHDEDYELKEIINFVDDHPILNTELLELGQYIHKKTLATLLSSYQTMLPSALKTNAKITKPKVVTCLKQVKDYIPQTEKEKSLLDLFVGNREITKQEANSISSYSVTKLINKGVLKTFTKEVYRNAISGIQIIEDIKLTNEQQNVINNISLHTFTPYLLHGVTGSGKTEVYMQLIAQVIKKHKKALVLVPEISLTPQLISTFTKRFGNRIAVLHSRLNNGEKYDEWRRIERDEVDIVIGARSAVFAPLTTIGIIIIDEEHSATYKQENNPRYSAIDMALWRAKHHHCPIILGSATPSIESYTRAKTGVYTLLEMTKRVNNKLPQVKLVDMKQEIRKKNLTFSSCLKEAINTCLNKHEQIILLLNRRGYSTVISCPNCGYTHKCPSCDIPLTYHLKKHKMNCHYCNYEVPKLKECPICHSPLNERGIGTEQLEEMTANLFPKARVIRMDVDTTSTKSAHEKIIKAFANQEYDILIGTQMIAKGLNFPNVTLVGVINGDSTLTIPDFRSAERTFQLLNQVSGRSGRANLEGHVIIQGFNMEHYSILCAANHDYRSFYLKEMGIRKVLQYPPFCNLCLIKIQSKDEQRCEEEASKIAIYLKNNLQDTVILGPAPSSMYKMNNVYSYQVILKYKDTKKILDSLRFIQSRYLNNKVMVSIDFNPYRI